MWNTKTEENADDLYLAGEKVLPGIYRQIGSGREIQLEAEDILPGSLDGRVACYMRIHNTWAQVSRQSVVRTQT